jgi:phosphonate transport system ATP-binding protein
MTPILTADGLSKSYNGRLVLDRVSIVLAPGELVAVLGPSGSGKTTLFRCLARLTEPDSGSVHLAGQPLLALKGRALAAARGRIGVVFQQFNLVRRLSALDNVLAARLATTPTWRVMLRSFTEADVALAVSALEAVGLGDHLDQRAATLSGGQQQRVAIARALAQDSRVLLADEPVASLDPETAGEILDLMQTLARSKGLAVLVTLHQPHLARQFADRIVHMRAGRIETSQEESTGRLPDRTERRTSAI